METDEGLPAILIAATEDLLNELTRRLRPNGYLVFEATQESEALHVVISQSRKIDLLLADVSMQGRTLAAALKSYRPDMRIMFVADIPKQNLSDVLTPEMAIAQIRSVLHLPKGITAEVLRTNFLGRPETCPRAIKKELSAERDVLVRQKNISPALYNACNRARAASM